MSKSVTRFVVRTQGGKVYHLVQNTSGKGYVWKSGEVGLLEAHFFASRSDAQQQIDAGYTAAGGGFAFVAQVAVKKVFMICVKHPDRTYWLKRLGHTTQYRWGSGLSGRKAACRFASRQEAAKVPPQNNGVGGVAAEVVEVLEIVG